MFVFETLNKNPAQSDTYTSQSYSTNQKPYLKFMKRLLLVTLILLNFTANVEAANFVLFKNPNSRASALAPSNWFMQEKLTTDGITTTLLRILSPDGLMHLEVTINPNTLPVRTFSEVSKAQFDEYAKDMINYHLALFRGSELVFLNKNANYNGIPSVIYIFKMNQDNKEFRYYIHSFIYNHHLYSIKFINRALGVLSPEDLVRIVNSVRIW